MNPAPILFPAAVDDWLRTSAALSALPDAPVVTDERRVVTAVVVAARRAASGGCVDEVRPGPLGVREFVTARPGGVMTRQRRLPPVGRGQGAADARRAGP